MSNARKTPVMPARAKAARRGIRYALGDELREITTEENIRIEVRTTSQNSCHPARCRTGRAGFCTCDRPCLCENLARIELEQVPGRPVWSAEVPWHEFGW